jgi:5-methyltetrahydrofolate--homocysteine methyltransferase
VTGDVGRSHIRGYDPDVSVSGLLIVGDRLNRSCRRTCSAISARDAGEIVAIAREQIAAGAGALDVNAGGAPTEADDLAWMVRSLRTVIVRRGIKRGASNIPLWIDTGLGEAASAALAQGADPMVLNPGKAVRGRKFPRGLCGVRIPGKRGRSGSRSYVGLVAQCSADDGPPHGVDQRLVLARKLCSELFRRDGPAIYLDPCLLPRSVEPDSVQCVAEVVRRLRREFPGLHFTAGIRNFSWGMPEAERPTVDAAALTELITAGMDAPIVDPARLALLPVDRALPPAGR